jgi:sugar lactone lactonase YvrE
MKRLLLGSIFALCACNRTDSYQVVTPAAQHLEITADAHRVAVIGGLHDPESVRYDTEQDVFFISNMEGFGSGEDGKAYIVRVNASDYKKAEIFIESDSNGAVLNAPKGMAILGDVLWVTDIDVLRGFDRRTGKPVSNIDLKPLGALQLNDIAAGPDGSLHVTDTRIVMNEKGNIYKGADRIFTIRADGSLHRSMTKQVALPNGITWDPVGRRWLVVSFDPFQGRVYELAENTGVLTAKVVARGPARFDGVEVLRDGRIVVTCWNDYSVHVFQGDKHIRIASGIHQPADLGVDTRRNRLLIPSVILGTVEVWALD